MLKKHFVYMYNTSAGKPVYVGYGKAVSRALSHTNRKPLLYSLSYEDEDGAKCS